MSSNSITHYGNYSGAINKLRVTYGNIEEQKSDISNRLHPMDCISCMPRSFNTLPLQCQVCVLNKQYNKIKNK